MKIALFTAIALVCGLAQADVQTITSPVKGENALFGSDIEVSGRDMLGSGFFMHGQHHFRQQDNGRWQYKQEIRLPSSLTSRNPRAFGSDVVISGDELFIADRALVRNGVNNAGGVVHFKRHSASQRWFYHQVISHINPQTQDGCGYSIAVSSDRQWLAVGCPYKNVSGVRDVGVIYLYQRNSSGQYIQRSQVQGSRAFDSLGLEPNMEIHGDLLIVPEWHDQDILARIYQRSGIHWSLKQTLRSGMSGNEPTGGAVMGGFNPLTRSIFLAAKATSDKGNLIEFAYRQEADAWYEKQRVDYPGEPAPEGVTYGVHIRYNGSNELLVKPDTTAHTVYRYRQGKFGWYVFDSWTRSNAAELRFGADIDYAANGIVVGATGHNNFDGAIFADYNPVVAPSTCTIDRPKNRGGFDCPAVWDPVCGCDGNTYSNSCYAERAGVSSWTEGPCNGNNNRLR